MYVFVLNAKKVVGVFFFFQSTEAFHIKERIKKTLAIYLNIYMINCINSIKYNNIFYYRVRGKLKTKANKYDLTISNSLT